MGVMAVGVAYIHQDLKQGNLLILLAAVLILLAVSLSGAAVFYASAAAIGWYDYDVFLSHGKAGMRAEAVFGELTR